MTELSIGAPRVSHDEGYTEVSVQVRAPLSLPETLWFRVSGHRHVSPEAATGAAVLALVMPAMRAGIPIRTSSAMGSALRESLVNEVMPALRQVNSDLSVVALDATDALFTPLPERGVITPLSGGVDSFYVLWQEGLLPTSPTSGSRVTDFLFANTGNHRGSFPLFHSRVRRAQVRAQQLGLPLTVVDSNVEDFYPPSLEFIRSSTLRNAAAAYLLSDSMSSLLYASTYARTDVVAMGRKETSVADAVILPALSFARFSFESGGADAHRIEKLEVIAPDPVVQAGLDVCVGMGFQGNCSTCWKCRRTLAGLELFGRIEEFGDVFDLDKWRKDRRYYWAHMRWETSPLYRETLLEATKRGYQVPQFSLRALLEHVVDVVTGGRVRVLMGRIIAGLKSRRGREWQSSDRRDVFSGLN